MKKKVLRLIEAGAFKGQAAFESLYAEWQRMREAYEQARLNKLASKKAYKALFHEEKPAEATMVRLLAEFRKAKLLQQFQKEELKLAGYILDKWVERYLAESNARIDSRLLSRALPTKDGAGVNKRVA